MREYEDKTKDQLIDELVELRQRITELETLENQLKLVEETLLESEERYRSLTDDILNTSTFGIFILDSDFRIVWVNQMLEHYLGIRRDEVIGKDKRQLIREQIKYIFEDPENFAEKVLATYDNNTYIENFECHILPDGEREERWLEHWSQPIRSGLYAGGRIEHYIDITERKKAGEALRKSEKKWRLLYDNLPGGSFIVNNNYIIKDVNDLLCTVTGYTKEELIGQLCDIICPKGPHKCPIFDLGKERIDNDETAVKRKDGQHVPVIKSARRIPLRDKELIVENFQDITDLKRAKEMLRESEERYRLLVENAPLGIISANKQGKIIDVNPKLLEILGSPSAEATRAINVLTFQPLVEAGISADIQRCMESEELVESEHPYTTNWGKKIHMGLHLTPLRDKDGQVNGAQAIVEDITERKRAEEALIESEEKFRSLAEHSPNMIFINKKGRVVYANKKCEDLMGYTKEEFYSPNFDFLILIAPESVEKVKSIFSKHMRGEELEPYDYDLITKDGKRIAVILTTKLINYEGEKAILGIVTDITERKKVEEELLFKTTLLEAQSETSIDGIIAVDSEGKSILFNKRLGEMWNIPQDILDTKDVEKIRQSVLSQLKYPDKFLEKVQHLYAKKDEKSREEIELKDGKIFDRYSSPLVDSNGKYHGRIWYFRDITERKLAEETIKESEERYRTLFEKSPVSITLVDKIGAIIDCNKSTEELTGFSKEEVIGKSFDKLLTLDPKDLPKLQEIFKKLSKGLEVEPYDLEIIRKDGKKRWINVINSFLVKEGLIVGFQIISSDITERKHKVEALKQRAEELERSKAELEQSLQELLERVEREHGDLVTQPTPVIDVEEKGALFLYPLDREEEAYSLFRSRKDAGRLALAITRTFPPRFHKKFGGEVETVWLTSSRVSGMVCVDPSDTMNLLLVLTEFFKRAPKGIILFEGLEYIINIAGFERFLNIVQLLNDKIALTDGTIYMILDLGVLEEKEAKHILRECLKPPEGVGTKEGIEDLENEDL